MGLGWFGPIADDGKHLNLSEMRALLKCASTVSDQLGYTATQVNWLGNIPNCAYLIVAFLIPICSRRLGIRYTVCLQFL